MFLGDRDRLVAKHLGDLLDLQLGVQEPIMSRRVTEAVAGHARVLRLLDASLFQQVTGGFTDVIFCSRSGPLAEVTGAAGCWDRLKGLDHNWRDRHLDNGRVRPLARLLATVDDLYATLWAWMNPVPAKMNDID